MAATLRDDDDDAKGRTRMALYCVQGVSILNVLAVHSKVGHGTYFFKHFINRAVSMFIVCFGVSSKLWCDNFAKKNNISNFTPSKFLNLYKHFVFGRLKRLVVPWWLTLFFWQATGVANKTSFLYKSAGLKPSKVNWFHAYFLAYAPQLGASWFATEILMQILLYPMLHLATTVKASSHVVDQIFLSLAVCLSALCVYIPENFLQGLKQSLGFYSSQIIWPSLYFGKILFGAMVLSKYCVNGESNRNQKNIKTQKDSEGIDGHEKRISTKNGLLSCVVTIMGSYVHVCLLSPSAFYFDDNEPFFQFTRELLDVPLAYSMFWSIQQIYATMKTYNIQILESVMENLYRIGKRTWALYLGHLILQNAIYLNYIPTLSFINRDKSRCLHFLLLFGCGSLFKKVLDSVG